MVILERARAGSKDRKPTEEGGYRTRNETEEEERREDGGLRWVAGCQGLPPAPPVTHLVVRGWGIGSLATKVEQQISYQNLDSLDPTP